MKESSSRRNFLGTGIAAGLMSAVGISSVAGNSPEGTADNEIARLGRHVVFASQTGAKLDSNVETGGGTDDTEILQAVLDKAQEWGSVCLILDGAALVRGLSIGSNTTIICPDKSCGLFLKGQTKAPLLWNKHPHASGERLDKNITIIGGTYHGNCLDQVHDYPRAQSDRPDSEITELFQGNVWAYIWEFFGVENFTARDVTLRDQRTFAMLMGNFYQAVFENIIIDLPHNFVVGNQDGLHFWGPGQFLTIRNIRGNSGDDFMALAPDECDMVSSITDVVIDGVFLDNADQGIRLLSRGEGRLDRVVIRNVTGTYRSFGFFICPWFNASGGNFGHIVFDTIDLRPTRHTHLYCPPFLFSISGKVESLELRNIMHHAPTDERVLIDLGTARAEAPDGRDWGPMDIKSVLIDGLRIYNPRFTETQPAVLTVNGPVHRLKIRDVEVYADGDLSPDYQKTGMLVQVKPEGSVQRLVLDKIDAVPLAEIVHIDDGGKVDEKVQFES